LHPIEEGMIRRKANTVLKKSITWDGERFLIENGSILNRQYGDPNISKKYCN